MEEPRPGRRDRLFGSDPRPGSLDGRASYQNEPWCDDCRTVAIRRPSAGRLSPPRIFWGARRQDRPQLSQFVNRRPELDDSGLFGGRFPSVKPLREDLA
jgi:hypothetical protein